MQVNNMRHDYRPDIDGLRALAILLVIGFHYFPSWIHGGFIGVDIFFVISGFLISKHLFADLHNNKFSYRSFYARRIKRIFPALCLVLLFSIIAGWVILTASEYERLGTHVAAGAGFISNLIYWHEAGYFDTAEDTKPLLHLWSLGIEEQFYILWPLMLSLFWRKQAQILWYLLTVFALSLIYSLFIVQTNVIADFYSPLTRIWEFVIGAALAYNNLYKPNFGKKPHFIFPWIGLCLILLTSFTINKDSLFPGAWALLPTIGAACLIFAGEKAWLNRYILSSRLLVWIGLISYPLYLWHWPLLAFLRVMDGQTPSFSLRIYAIALSIFFAWLSYKFVECPIRFQGKKPRTIAILCISLALICSTGLVIRHQNGFKSRQLSLLNGDPKTLILGVDRNNLAHNCGLTNSELSHYQWCLSDPRQSAKYALIGDSKAEAIYYGLVRESKLGKGSWILVGSVFPSNDKPKENLKYQIALQNIINNPTIKVVVLAVAMRDIFPINLNTGFIDINVTPSFPSKIALYSHTIQDLQRHGKKVVFYIDNPTFPDPSSCVSGGLTTNGLLNKFLHRKEDPRCTISYAADLKGRAPYRQFVTDLKQANPELLVFDPTTLLCDIQHNQCTVTENGNFLYSYSDHISDYANSKIAKVMLPIIYSLKY